MFKLFHRFTAASPCKCVKCGKVNKRPKRHIYQDGKYCRCAVCYRNRAWSELSEDERTSFGEEKNYHRWKVSQRHPVPDDKYCLFRCSDCPAHYKVAHVYEYTSEASCSRRCSVCGHAPNRPKHSFDDSIYIFEDAICSRCGVHESCLKDVEHEWGFTGKSGGHPWSGVYNRAGCQIRCKRCGKIEYVSHSYTNGRIALLEADIGLGAICVKCGKTKTSDMYGERNLHSFDEFVSNYQRYRFRASR